MVIASQNIEQKPGYKQTEIGVIPEGWEVRRIGDVVTDFRGGAPLTPSDFIRDGVRVLPKGGVARGGRLRIQESEQQFCSQKYANAHSTNQVDSLYTIVVLRDLVPSGPSIGLIVKIESSNSFILAQGVYGFKIVQDQVDTEYLIQLSNGLSYRKLMNSIMVGSTQVHITNTAFKNVLLPFPPLPEQHTIATALSDMDALITSLDKLIAKKRDIKQAMMQQLLTGKTRLSKFSKGTIQRYKRTEIGEIPEDWDVKKLGEIGECLIGLTYQPDDVKSNGLLVLRSSNIGDNSLLFTDNVFVDVEVADKLIVRKDDILICVRNGSKNLIGKCALIQ